MPLLHIPLKSSRGRIHFNMNLRWRKKNTFLGHCGNPPNCVWFPNDPPPRAIGRAEAATGFIQRVGTDFKGPSSSQTPGLCYSHLFTWSELPGYLQNCGRRMWRESSQVLWYLWNQSVRSLLGMSLPLSIAIRVLFLRNTHIFLCGPAVSMRKHPRKCPSCLRVPQQMEPCSGWRLTGIKRHRWAVGPRWGSGGFEHAHIVSVKGQAAR